MAAPSSTGGSGRVGPIDPGRLRPDQQAVFDRIAGTRGRVAGPFTALLHVPELADRVQRLGAYLRYDATLPRDVAETGVLVTAAARGSHFEWDAHEPLARAAGVPDEVLVAIREGSEAGSLPARFRAVVEYGRQLADAGRVSDEAYRALLEEIGADGVVELTVLVGYYTLLAMTLAAHALEPPAER